MMTITSPVKSFYIFRSSELILDDADVVDHFEMSIAHGYCYLVGLTSEGKFTQLQASCGHGILLMMCEVKQ